MAAESTFAANSTCTASGSREAAAQARRSETFQPTFAPSSKLPSSSFSSSLCGLMPLNRDSRAGDCELGAFDEAGRGFDPMNPLPASSKAPSSQSPARESRFNGMSPHRLELKDDEGNFEDGAKVG